MRNQIAHIGFQPDQNEALMPEVLELMSKRDKCLAALRGYFDTLLPEQPM